MSEAKRSDDISMNGSDEEIIDGNEEQMMLEEEGDAKPLPKKVYLPGHDSAKNEELECDESTYVLYHTAQTGSPCLSFDIINDNLGSDRSSFPLTAYAVAGTQAEQTNKNILLVMKMSNLHKTQKAPKKDSDSDDSSDDDDEEEDLDKKPQMEVASVMHSGGVNRIRCTKLGDTHVAATWSERKSVHIWSLEEQLKAVDDPILLSEYIKNKKKTTTPPLFTYAGHADEGFALDWSRLTPGSLLTGDCQKNIHLWKLHDDGTWVVDQRPFSGHTGSVEDIQWSPNEKSVFASCSVDFTVKIWDIRANPSKACMLSKRAHDADVNVMNWNKNDPFLVTGGDDGFIKVWDLRQFEQKGVIAKFKHHTAPITSVEWHPTDRSVFAAAGDDNQITQWDLSVEPDDSETDSTVSDLPPQLLFIHQGQTDIKELHWHSQIPGLIISTASDGFNIFKTISI